MACLPPPPQTGMPASSTFFFLEQGGRAKVEARTGLGECGLIRPRRGVETAAVPAAESNAPSHAVEPYTSLLGSVSTKQWAAGALHRGREPRWQLPSFTAF